MIHKKKLRYVLGDCYVVLAAVTVLLAACAPSPVAQPEDPSPAPPVQDTATSYPRLHHSDFARLPKTPNPNLA
jgi:hypothetical protein